MKPQKPKPPHIEGCMGQKQKLFYGSPWKNTVTEQGRFCGILGQNHKFWTQLSENREYFLRGDIIKKIGGQYCILLQILMEIHWATEKSFDAQGPLKVLAKSNGPGKTFTSYGCISVITVSVYRQLNESLVPEDPELMDLRAWSQRTQNWVES